MALLLNDEASSFVLLSQFQQMLQFLAPMVLFVLWVELVYTKEEWRSATIISGAQSVTTLSAVLMPELCVDSWDIQQ